MGIPHLTRREALKAVFVALGSAQAAAKPAVSTLIGTGSPGYSDREVNNPYGVVIGPDRGLYFCDLDNQRIRRLDLTTHRTTTIAGNGQKRTAVMAARQPSASLSMPHEIQFDAAGNMYIAERDNHVVRKVDAKTGVISTFAGTGAPGFSGDGGPAARAQLRQPHSIAVDPQRPAPHLRRRQSPDSTGGLCRAAQSRPTGARANGCRRLMALREECPVERTSHDRDRW